MAQWRNKIGDMQAEESDKSYGRNWVMRPIRRRGDPVSL